MVRIDFGLEYWIWEGVIKWNNKRKGKRKKGKKGITLVLMLAS